MTEGKPMRLEPQAAENRECEACADFDEPGTECHPERRGDGCTLGGHVTDLHAEIARLRAEVELLATALRKVRDWYTSVEPIDPDDVDGGEYRPFHGERVFTPEVEAALAGPREEAP